MDSLWTRSSPRREVREKLVDKCVSTGRGVGYRWPCSKGPWTESSVADANQRCWLRTSGSFGRFCVPGQRGAWHHRRVIVPEPALAPDAIRAARDAIDPVFLDSPQFVHDGLSARLGVPVIVKVETVNPIRSFKGRGTWVAVRGAGRGGEDRPRAADRLCLGRQLRTRRGLCGPRARHPGRRLHLGARQSAQGRADAGTRRRGDRGGGGLRRRLAPRPRRTPQRTRSSSSSMARTRGSRPARPRSRSR